MLCPFCSSPRTKVATQQIGPENTVTRIRRCQSCEKNFCTIEHPVPSKLTDFNSGVQPRQRTAVRQFAWWIQEQVRRFDEAA